MGSGASSLSAGAGNLYDPLDGSQSDGSGGQVDYAAHAVVAPSTQALIKAAESHRDDLVAAKGNFDTRCDELRDSMQFDALVTLLRSEEETPAVLIQLATALLCATGDAEQAMAAADKGLEMAAGDGEALFNGHAARGLIQCVQLQAEPSMSSFQAALDLAKTKVEMSKHALARAKRLSGSCSDALEVVEKATLRRDGKTAENFLELGNCRVTCYTETLADAEAIPAAGTKEAKQWNAKCLDLLVEAHQSFESAATKMAKVGGHAVALASDAAVLEEIYVFQQMRRLDEVVVKTSEKKEDKNTIEGFCFVDPQGEINAICKNAGHYEKLTDEQQLKCLEEEHKSFREFGVMDKAEEVQALHGWKAKEIHLKKATKKKTVATGPAAEFGIGGAKAISLAVSQLEAASKISPHRPELWLHLGRLRTLAEVCNADGEEEAEVGTALEQAMEDLKTSLGLVKDCKGAPPHTETCARFHLGLLLAMKTSKDGGPPSAQAKQHSQARALMAPGISHWLALLRDSCSAAPAVYPPSGRVPLDSERPMRRNNPVFVEAFRRCGEGLVAYGGGGDDDPDGSLARRYLQTVVDVVPPLLKQCCHASQTNTRNTLQHSFFAAQLSLVSCELSRWSQAEAPQAVLVAATRPICERVQLALTEAWECGDAAGLRELRQRACEQRTEIDTKRSATWLDLGVALFDDYENIVAAQRADDSEEVKSETRRQRLQLLGQAVRSLEKAIELEDSRNLTDKEVFDGQAYLQNQCKSGSAGGSATGKNATIAKASGGKAVKAAQKKKPAVGTGATKTTKSKPAASSKAGPGKNSQTGAVSKEKLKGPPAEGKDTVQEGTAAAVTAQVLSAADLEAAQEYNTASSKARLRLADVLKELLEEASVAGDQEGAPKTNTDEVVAGTKTVDETKARMVELYNQVIEIEPENEDAYIGCCELLKADGKNLEAVAVYCKYPLSPAGPDGIMPESDARIHGEIVTLLMKDVSKISKDLHKQLGASLTVFAKKNGITTVEDWLNKLADIAAFEVCKEVYAAVNDKPLDDPEMVRLFEIKGYP